MSADFFSVAVPLDADRAEELLPLLAGAEQEYNGNIYVDATDELLAMIEDHSGVVMSPNFPVLVAIDRFAANRKLLGGHAFRWIPAGELATFHTFVEKLDARAAADEIDRWGNGTDDVATGLAALGTGIEQAARGELGLLLVCFPA
jgi:hypothetical protein